MQSAVQTETVNSLRYNLFVCGAGCCIFATFESGERKGTAPDLPQGVADGERRPQTHESQLLPHGKPAESVTQTLRLPSL